MGFSSCWKFFLLAAGIAAGFLSWPSSVEQARASDGSASVAVINGLSERSLRKVARKPSGRKTARTFSTQCPSVRGVSGREFLYKSEISHHISPGDQRATGPTFICNRVCVARGQTRIPIFTSHGEQVADLGYYGTWDVNGSARYYCGAGGAEQCHNSALARKAREGNGRLYVKLGPVCYEVSPYGRTGSAT